MYLLRVAAVLALVVSTTATPIQVDAATPSFVNYVDNFDDHQTPAESVGAVNAVGIYNVLQYNGLSFANSSLQVVSPKPPSMPNYIFGGLTDTDQIQIKPANSSIPRFNLYSMRYACALNGAGTAQGCTIQVAGRKASGYGFTTAVKELVYNPTGVLGATFNIAFFPPADFSNLYEVTIAVIATKNAPGLTIPFFDNVDYRAYFK